jgi:hypothetical protein
MLTQKQPGATELPDDIPAVKNYYHPPIAEKNVSLTIATPSLEIAYKLGKVKVVRRLISPLLSGGDQTLMPLGVEEFEVENAAKEAQEITLVVPRPSLVNLQEKELKPTDQDSVYVCSAAVHGQKHEEFRVRGRPGRHHGQHGNRQPHGAGGGRIARRVGGSAALFLPEPATRTTCCSTRTAASSKSAARAPQRLRRGHQPHVHRRAAGHQKIPVAVVLDFPEQVYIDGAKFERKYVKSFPNEESRRSTWPSSRWTAIRSGGTGPWRFRSASSIRSKPAHPIKATGRRPAPDPADPERTPFPALQRHCLGRGRKGQ